MRRVVIAGASACGASAVGGLREYGFDGEIVLIGDEPLPPYERPPLSKEYLRGDMPLDRTFLRPADWYEEQDVATRFGVHVERIDPAAGTVTCDDGSDVPYDSLLIATGIRNRRLSVPGSELAGVHHLRVASDADAIREAASGASRVAIVGMGFIGAEVAASLCEMGLEVTVIEPFETALFRVLGAEFGRVIEEVHRSHGVQMRFNEGVGGFEGNGRVEAVLTTSGERVACDLAVVGVGTVPNSELAEAAGIACDNGVLVDGMLRTNAPGVFAGGDVANHDHPFFGRLRVEHFDNAVKMGATIARNILGADEVFADPHWFWSDQYDVSIQMAGFAPAHDEMVVRGSIDERNFSAFYLNKGTVSQVLGIDRPRDVRRTIPLIRDRIAVDPVRLADDAVDLRDLATAG